MLALTPLPSASSCLMLKHSRSVRGLVGGRGGDGRDLPADTPSEESSNRRSRERRLFYSASGLSDCTASHWALAKVPSSLAYVVRIGNVGADCR